MLIIGLSFNFKERLILHSHVWLIVASVPMVRHVRCCSTSFKAIMRLLKPACANWDVAAVAGVASPCWWVRGLMCVDAAGSERGHHGPFGWQSFDGLKHASLRCLFTYYLLLSSAVSSTSVSWRDPFFSKMVPEQIPWYISVDMFILILYLA